MFEYNCKLLAWQFSCIVFEFLVFFCSASHCRCIWKIHSSVCGDMANIMRLQSSSWRQMSGKRYVSESGTQSVSQSGSLQNNFSMSARSWKQCQVCLSIFLLDWSMWRMCHFHFLPWHMDTKSNLNLSQCLSHLFCFSLLWSPDDDDGSFRLYNWKNYLLRVAFSPARPLLVSKNLLQLLG